MSNPERDVANMRRMVMEAQQNLQFDIIEEFMSDKFFNHTSVPPLTNDKAGVYAVMKWLHTMFSDIRMEIIHSVSDGKVICTNKVLHGRLEQPWKGISENVGKKGFIRIMDFVEVDKDGKAISHWACSGDWENEHEDDGKK